MLVRSGTEDEVIVGVLKLVDLSLTANLLLIVIWSGYENFVARIEPSEEAKCPEGLTGIGFSGLKQKLLGSILAIAAVNVLEWFIDIDRSVDNIKLGWVVGILLAFAVAMLVLAIADRHTANKEDKSK
ncbi:MAG: YqhA family protein [Rhodomicrobium sp.]